eukprot:IDg13294t1
MSAVKESPEPHFASSNTSLPPLSPPQPIDPSPSSARADDRCSKSGRHSRFTAREDLIIVREVAAVSAHIAEYGTTRALRLPHVRSGTRGGELRVLNELLSQMQEDHNELCEKNSTEKRRVLKDEEDKELIGRDLVAAATSRKKAPLWLKERCCSSAISTQSNAQRTRSIACREGKSARRRTSWNSRSFSKMARGPPFGELLRTKSALKLALVSRNLFFLYPESPYTQNLTPPTSKTPGNA